MALARGETDGTVEVREDLCSERSAVLTTKQFLRGAVHSLIRRLQVEHCAQGRLLREGKTAVLPRLLGPHAVSRLCESPARSSAMSGMFGCAGLRRYDVACILACVVA